MKLFPLETDFFDSSRKKVTSSADMSKFLDVLKFVSKLIAFD